MAGLARPVLDAPRIRAPPRPAGSYWWGRGGYAVRAAQRVRRVHMGVGEGCPGHPQGWGQEGGCRRVPGGGVALCRAVKARLRGRKLGSECNIGFFGILDR